VLVAGVLIYAARRGPVTPELLALQVNVLIGVLLLNHASYIEIYGSARAAAGVALFSLLCLPLLARVRSPDWWPVRLTWILWTFPYLVYGMLISARWAWMIAALAWLVATQIELVRAVRRGIRALRGDAVPSATSSRGAMS
jgi:hypothetical protein